MCIRALCLMMSDQKTIGQIGRIPQAPGRVANGGWIDINEQVTQYIFGEMSFGVMSFGVRTECLRMQI